MTRYVGTAESAGNVADLGSRCVLIGETMPEGIITCEPSHSTGTVRFGLDGSLLLGAGDGANFFVADAGGQDPECFGNGLFGTDQDVGAFRSQYLGSYAGKILRVDPATGLGLPSNPHWTGDGADIRSKIWANGLRNPFRFAVRPDTPGPGTLFIGDVGWSTRAWTSPRFARSGFLDAAELSSHATMDIGAHNSNAWDREVVNGNPWTVPVCAGVVDRARRGDWSILLTPTRTVPREWLEPIADRRILCLASGGGQQGPVLAAAGAEVTVLDNSPGQLAQDRAVAEREGLSLKLELGVMTDLSRFEAASFDLVVHPVSNVFVPDVRLVWRGVSRVLAPNGAVLAGMCNPLTYLFDWAEHASTGALHVRYPIPYSDVGHLPPDQLEARLTAGEPLEFGHSLEDLLAGQLDAGFVLTGFYEDTDPESPIAPFTPTFIATRAAKVSGDPRSTHARGPVARRP